MARMGDLTPENRSTPKLWLWTASARERSDLQSEKIRPQGYLPRAISHELRSAKATSRSLPGQASWESAWFGLLGSPRSGRTGSRGQKFSQRFVARLENARALVGKRFDLWDIHFGEPEGAVW